jgi:phi13 family phage major tail protein
MSEPILLDKVLPVVGMRELVYAVLTSDTDVGAVYDTVKRVRGVQSLNFTPQSGQQQSYGDDGTFCIVNANGDADGEVDLNTIPSDMAVDWFGHTLDANGAVVQSPDDKVNPVAIGFRAEKSSGGDKLVWLYKCIPSAPEKAFKGKEGTSVTIQNSKVKFKAIARDYDRKTFISVDSDAAGLAASVVTNWTKAVYEPADTKTVDP